MGVNGLWQLLAPVSRPIALETLAHRRLAIDASIWMYQFQMAMRDKKTGEPLQGAHIVGTFRRIVKLLFHGIKPVFVFDGDAPMLKKRTIAERKKRKQGAVKNLAKTAQQLLSAQLRAAAAEQQLRKQQRKRATHDSDDTGDLIDPSTAVYLSDLDHPRATTTSLAALPQQPRKPPPPTKAIPKDAYALPTLGGSLQSLALPSDPRLATESELRDFIDQMRPEDVDLDSGFFGALPVEVKYEIVGDLRIKSRQVNHRRVEEMRHVATPLDFSKAQIENLMERNALTQKLFEVTDTLGQASIRIPTRVAGTKNREYLLVKQLDAHGGGWVLGVRNPELARTDPIVVDDSDDSHDARDATDSDDFEEVKPAPRKASSPALPDLETRRILALEAIRSRYAPHPFPTTDFDPLIDAPTASGGATLFQFDPDPDPDHDYDHDHDHIDEVEDDIAFQRALITSLLNGTAAIEGNPVAHGNEESAGSVERLELSSLSRRAPSPPPLPSLPPAEGENEAGAVSDESFEFVSESRPVLAGPPLPKPIQQQVPLPVLELDREEDDGSDEFEEVVPLATATPAPPSLGPPRSTSSPSPPTPPPPPLAPVAGTTRVLSAMDSILPSDSDDDEVATAPRSVLRAPSVRAPFPTSTPAPPAVVVASIHAPAVAKKNDTNVERPQPVASSSKVTLDDAFNTFSPPTPQPAIPTPVSPLEAPTTPSPDLSRLLQPDNAAQEGGAPAEASAEDEEEFFDWEKSPTPPPRPALVSEEQPDFEEEPDFSVDDDELDLEREMNGYADTVSRLNHRDLAEMRDVAQTEVAQLAAQKHADQRNADGVTRQMASDIKDLLHLFGIPWVDAPQEAEAECAELLRRHLVDGIVTDDSDVFLFGGARVYRHMFNDARYVECYLLADLERELGLDRDKLVRLAYLLGGDYTEGLPGVGPVLGRELLEEFDGPDGLERFKAWWSKVQNGKDDDDDTGTPWRRKFKRGHKSLFIDENWPNPAIARAYYQPVVNTDEEAFSWAGPDLDGLRNYLASTLSWNSTKTDEVMLPLIKRTNDRKAGKIKTQGYLGDYFDISAGNGPLAPREKRIGYASGRLQNVVQTWRKKQRKAESDAESDPEQEPPAPRPKPKRKAARAKPVSSAESEGDAERDPKGKKKAPRRKKKLAATAGGGGEPARSTAASRKRAEAARREARAAARGGEYSSDDEALAGPPPGRSRSAAGSGEDDLAPAGRRRPKPRRVAAQKRPIVDHGSDSDDVPLARKRRKSVAEEEEN